ncbi:hypothetical protein KGF57_000727 [Candida theae]|uniref:Membrane anchor Opy2 N-terminal domain-containing protein n=1 Tax=Candida theae TaxID=1198502 RepID=A0AAD5G0E3_9ASCO|nr:uncharacterized protein KGF57_000727 [Candida theae]KAI5965461.1 hypothetical protein KGF57_000727 [Candida theae]
MTLTGSHIFDYVHLVQRDDNGCVTNCPALSECTCPSKNEECVQVAQTCEKCAYNQCRPQQISHKTNTGAIVGGVIGGVVLIALVGALYYYFRIFKKKPPVVLDDEYDDSYHDEDTDGFVSDKGGGYALSSLASRGANNSRSNVSDQQFSPTESHFPGAVQREGNGGGSPTNAHFGKDAATSGGPAGPNGAQTGVAAGPAAPQRPPARRVLSGEARAKAKRRISSYESFTRPNALKSKSKQQQQLAAQQRRARQQKIVKQANLQQQQQHQQLQVPTTDGAGNLVYSNQSHRSSVATSISNASNILPIAYIPGVTVRPTRNNTGSLYSYDSDSLFSDLNTIENASIVGENAVGNHGQAVGASVGENGGNGSSPSPATMTAIKAQPKLVNVDKIEEEEEEDDDEDEDAYLNGESVAGAYASTSHHGFDSEVLHETDDSDVDSDIGQITRATSTKKLNKKSISHSDVEGTTMRSFDHTSSSLPQNREILMNHSSSSSNVSHIPTGMMQYNSDHDSNRDAWSTVGSFLFDIGFDDNSASSPSNAAAFDESNRKGSPFADGSV